MSGTSRRTERGDRRGPARVRAHRTVLLALALLALPGAPAADPDGTRLAVLDGMSFTGHFGPKGSHARDRDTFVFEGGRFTSTGCLEYGFTPRPYWVREEGGAVHFLAEMASEDNGTIVYRGRVLGDRLEATYTWTRERWYWHVEREFWFSGRRDAPR